MKRFDQQTYISKKLSELVTEVRINGKLNMLHLHVISENFYVDFLNLIYGWNLKNMNGIQQNSEAIDLVDHSNKLVVQVSSTSTKNKVESSLKKLSDEYTGYTFKFVPISDDSGPLRKKTFNTPNISILIKKKIF